MSAPCCSGRAKMEEALIRDVHPNLDVLPADGVSMGHAGRQLTDPWVRSRLIDILDAAREQWDIVLVDTPGHQSAVIAAALGGSSGALVPMVPEAGPVAELPTILTTIRIERRQPRPTRGVRHHQNAHLGGQRVPASG